MIERTAARILGGVAAAAVAFLHPVEARAQRVVGEVEFDQTCVLTISMDSRGFVPRPLLIIRSVDFPKGVESAVVLREMHSDFEAGFTYTEWKQLQRRRIPQTMPLDSGDSYSLALRRIMAIDPKTGVIEVDRQAAFFLKEFKARECGFLDIPTRSL